jgi:LysM repeat protein
MRILPRNDGWKTIFLEAKEKHMRVSIVAGMIVAVHVAVVGSVLMTQGCATKGSGPQDEEPIYTEPAPPPVLPPLVPVLPPHPVTPAVPPVELPAEVSPGAPSAASANTYVVKAGDSLSKIAARHGVNAKELAELNQIADPNKIRIGQKLLLPDHSKVSTSKPAPKAASKAAAGEGTYVVKAGDALSKIASAHGVKTKDLMEANQIADANKIRIGQKLVIPGAKPVAAAAAPAVAAEPAAAAPKAPAAPASLPVVDVADPAADEDMDAFLAPPPASVPEMELEGFLDYSVQDSDTIDGIARLFVVSASEIRRVNGIPANQDVKPGQRIRIPPNVPQ